MKSFSPYIFKIHELSPLTIDDINSYYNSSTFLGKDKDKKRNAYKVSLAHLIHYLVDFGIGYNSVCVTALSKPQVFTSGLYVNRHSTRSKQRPATVADLKEKVLDILETLIRVAVRGNGTADNSTDGIRDRNKIFPKCIFTQDKSSGLINKLKKLTGHTYQEKEFTDFIFTSSNYVNTRLEYENGYITDIDNYLTIQAHTHDVASLGNKITYKADGHLDPQGNTVWGNWHLINSLAYTDGSTKDTNINPINGAKTESDVSSHLCEEAAYTSPTIPWAYPSGVNCAPGGRMDPAGLTTIGGNKCINIRYPGRRYRLFVRQD